MLDVFRTGLEASHCTSVQFVQARHTEQILKEATACPNCNESREYLPMSSSNGGHRNRTIQTR